MIRRWFDRMGALAVAGAYLLYDTVAHRHQQPS